MGDAMLQRETFNWEPISILFSLGNKGFNGGDFFFNGIFSGKFLKYRKQWTRYCLVAD